VTVNIIVIWCFVLGLCELINVSLCKEKTAIIMLKILDTTFVGAMQVAKEFGTTCCTDSQRSYTLCMMLGYGAGSTLYFWINCYMICEITKQKLL
jgi:hypothetical protein